jgi:hypothetical protein
MRFSSFATVKVATTSFMLFSITAFPPSCYALTEKDSKTNSKSEDNGKTDKENSFNVNDVLNNMAIKGKAAFDAVDPDFLKKFGPFFSGENIEEVSKYTHRFFEAGAPGKVSLIFNFR